MWSQLYCMSDILSVAYVYSTAVGDQDHQQQRHDLVHSVMEAAAERDPPAHATSTVENGPLMRVTIFYYRCTMLDAS